MTNKLFSSKDLTERRESGRKCYALIFAVVALSLAVNNICFVFHGSCYYEN